jgi:uncharacterized cupredoxin-like copper-binding protein
MHTITSGPTKTATSGPTRRTVLVGLSGVAVTSLAGCAGAPRADAGQEVTTVGVELTDYDIVLTRPAAPEGPVRFEVENVAEQLHEFVVVQTDLAPDALPTDENGDVVESELDILGEVEDLEGGAREELELTLEAGPYVFICNIPAHYRLGMRTGFTVDPVE